jgi:hypothetical protein
MTITNVQSLFYRARDVLQCQSFELASVACPLRINAMTNWDFSNLTDDQFERVRWPHHTNQQRDRYVCLLELSIWLCLDAVLASVRLASRMITAIAVPAPSAGHRRRSYSLFSTRGEKERRQCERGNSVQRGDSPDYHSSDFAVRPG